jgi:AcrR family transcriptional regulator
MTTKDKIIETSVKLFNEKGCLNTSTRHISNELGISVGNLYYHFKNKEEILIEIFLRYVNAVFKEISFLNHSQDEIFLLKNFLVDTLDSNIEYRFLHLELNLLLISFSKFKTIMQEQLKLEIKMIKELLYHQIKYGYLKQLNEIEIEFSVSNSWILAASNLAYWNLLSDDIIKNVKKGSLNVYYLIKPYLTQKSLENENIKVIEEFLLKDFHE